MNAIKFQETVDCLRRYGVTWESRVENAEIILEFEIPDDAHKETVAALILDFYRYMDRLYQKHNDGAGLATCHVDAPPGFPEIQKSQP